MLLFLSDWQSESNQRLVALLNKSKETIIATPAGCLQTGQTLIFSASGFSGVAIYGALGHVPPLEF